MNKLAFLYNLVVMWLACDLNISASFFSIVIKMINTKAFLMKVERGEVLFSLYNEV